MSLWKRFLRAATKVENRIDTARGRWIPFNETVTILPYIGHGTVQKLRLQGRVLEYHRVRPALDTDGRWRNVRNIYHRFVSVEVPHAKIQARFQGQVQDITADDEGYFIVQFDLEQPLISSDIWQYIDLYYDDGVRQAEAQGRVLIPPPQAEYAIITDLDDTVWRTDVTNLIRMLWNTITKNAHTRSPFQGVSEFYKALQAGQGTGILNPIYYVSNSPYNLYDLIQQFLEVHEIPLGPIFLRDLGLTENYLLASRLHKFSTIDRLMSMYTDLPFILIGDSGEHDADIYLQVIQTYPNRIKGVYIRDVQPNRKNTRRDKRVQQLAERARELGCEMILIQDTATAAVHAMQAGFIKAESLDTILSAVNADARYERTELGL